MESIRLNFELHCIFEIETISESMVINSFNKGLFHSFQVLSEYLLLACFGWIIFIIPFIFVVYFFVWKCIHWLSKNFDDTFIDLSKG